MKSAAAAATTSITAALQGVLGFTAFGSKLGPERTLIVAVSAAAMIVTIVAWTITTDGDARSRRIIGFTGLAATLVLALTTLWATFTFHSVLVDTRRVRQETITTLRGPLAPADVDIEFFTHPDAPITFIGYGGTAVSGQAGIERFTDTKFILHRFSSEKTIVLHHVSRLRVEYQPPDGPVEFTTRPAIRRRLWLATTAGGVLCGGAALLIWWFTPLQQSPEPHMRRIGFRIQGR